MINGTYIESNYITDISPLQNLKKLKFLNIQNNSISDIVYLKNLTNLENLYVGGNKIVDITPLKFLDKIKEDSSYRGALRAYKGNKYLNISFKVKMNENIYYTEDSKCYIDQNGDIYFEKADVNILLNIANGSTELCNKLKDGIVVRGAKKFYSEEIKSWNKNTQFADGYFFYKDDTKKYKYSSNPSKWEGCYELLDNTYYHYFKLNEVFTTIGINYKIDVDKENGIFIFSLEI